VLSGLLSAIAAVLFAGLPKVWEKSLGIVGVVAVLLLLGWFMLREQGVFFDVVLPTVTLGLHSIYARVFEVWEAA